MDAALLARAARYFSLRREYLGYWLEIYREEEGLEPPALARVLGCSLETLRHLALCFAPRADRLFEDTAELAERYGIEQDRLADLFHDAEVYEARKAAPSPAPGPAPAAGPRGLPAFAAARDREPEAEGEAASQAGDEGDGGDGDGR